MTLPNHTEKNIFYPDPKLIPADGRGTTLDQRTATESLHASRGLAIRPATQHPPKRSLNHFLQNPQLIDHGRS